VRNSFSECSNICDNSRTKFFCTLVSIPSCSVSSQRLQIFMLCNAETPYHHSRRCEQEETVYNHFSVKLLTQLHLTIIKLTIEYSSSSFVNGSVRRCYISSKFIIYVIIFARIITTCRLFYNYFVMRSVYELSPNLYQKVCKQLFLK